MKLLVVIGSALWLAGCGAQRLVVKEPVTVVETRTVVERVDRASCDTSGVVMPEGDLAEIPQVARQRKALIETLVGRLDAICDHHAK